MADQRRASRRALAEAARLAGCPDETFEKSSARGRPVPTSSGWHWSISHDASFVAAVVSRHGPIGVDLERIALRRRLLVERVANAQERALLGERGERLLDAEGFARLWTSKEAVLKAEQIGLPGLQRCHLVELRGAHRTRVTYDGVERDVYHTRTGTHLVSLSASPLHGAPLRVVWSL